MSHPDVVSQPEAIYAITKYNILKNIGAGYTWSTLDTESYENIQLMNLCMQYEARAIENSHSKTQFLENLK